MFSGSFFVDAFVDSDDGFIEIFKDEGACAGFMEGPEVVVFGALDGG